MTRTLAKTLMALGMAAGAMHAVAQDPGPGFGWSICIDPTNTMPYSIPFGVLTRANLLFRVSVGALGTVTYYGQNSICFTQAHTYNVAGRIGFASGPQGSLQSDQDDDMAYTFGMPNEPAGPWSYTSIIRVDPTDANLVPHYQLFGSAIGTFFEGASGRYLYIDQTSDGVFTQLRADVVGDAGRLHYTLTNVGTTPQQIGLWYGADIAMLQGDLNLFQATGGLFGSFPVYIVSPGRKPYAVDTRIRRASDPSNFPPYVQFLWGQTTAYGLEVDLGPTEQTTDSNGDSDATLADEVTIGHPVFLRGDPLGGNDVVTPPDAVLGDTGLGLGDPAFVQKYYPGTGGAVPVNQARNIICYYRDTWGNSKYTRPSLVVGQNTGDQPYTTVIDAPHILVQDDAGTGTNGLGNNPFSVYAWVDNVGGYSDVYTGVVLNDVRMTISLPPGLSLIGGDQATKTLFQVNPQELKSVSWQVQSDGIVIGDLPYTVTITSTPGPTHPIVHSGIIRVSATKQIPLVPAANLISTPWVFTDSSWEAVLGLSIPDDFTAYDWDPEQNGYVVSSSAARGKGTWIILNPTTHPNPEVVPYAGATSPGDILSGTANIQLKAGWNLIGNPYPYAIPVSQIVGVSAANPSQSYIWADLVAQNTVASYLAYWDTTINNYRYIQGLNAIMQPNQGYWINVQTAQDLTLNFPQVFDTFVPGGRVVHVGPWVQSANQWRLNLQAKSSRGQDVEDYLGVATGTAAKDLEIAKPPVGPTQDLNLSFDGAIAGKNVRLAQAMSDHNGQLEWRVFVQAKTAGPVSLSWPNMSTLPRNISFRLVDPVTHQSLDMRAVTSTTFTAAANSSREFRVQSTASSSSLPIIGNVTTAAGRLTGKVSATMSFALNYNANVTVRVRNSQGNIVAVLRDGVDMNKGSNSAAWNLKNSSGSYVAAGTYQAEIVASSGGDTASKVVNLVVNR